MIITIENFGVIKHFQFDTEKDLYLLFGKNSMGKSYAISLVYLIIKNLKIFERVGDVFFLEMRRLEWSSKKLDVEENYKNEMEKTLIELFEKFIKTLSTSLENTFSSIENLQNKFTEKPLKITMTGAAFSLLLGIEKKANQNKAIQLVILNLELNKDTVKRFTKKPLASEGIRFYNFFKELDSVNNVYYLPASRSGLYQALNAFGAIFAELAKNRSFTSKPISIPAISEPVADYFLHLSNITSRKSNHDLQSYIEEIEKEILQGSVEFNSETKHLLFTPSNLPLVLDLSVTSSMVSEISPIVAYLKYILSTNKKQKPLIFIEEPEAHLHPENQVKLMAVFARLVKDNKIKLVATSHSNYIFNKASNLVIDNKIDRGKFVAVLFANTSEGSETRALETDEYGIEDDNFIDTAESLYAEKMALFDKLNEQ